MFTFWLNQVSELYYRIELLAWSNDTLKIDFLAQRDMYRACKRFGIINLEPSGSTNAKPQSPMRKHIHQSGIALSSQS